jgi:hypothetical protein
MRGGWRGVSSDGSLRPRLSATGTRARGTPPWRRVRARFRPRTQAPRPSRFAIPPAAWSRRPPRSISNRRIQREANINADGLPGIVTTN